MKGSRSGAIVVTVLVVLVVLAGLGLLFVYSGVFNVAASRRPSGFEHWVLTTVRENSIDRRAENITIPSLDDSAMVMQGLVHYRESCADCHGVPGAGRDEFAEHMNPRPPPFFSTPEDRARFQARMKRAEKEGAAGAGREERERHEKEELRSNFWKVKYGVAMTGMPAFGSTHTDQEIWDMLAFKERMRSMTAEQYRKLVAALPDSLVREHEEDHPEKPDPDTSGGKDASGG